MNNNLRRRFERFCFHNRDKGIPNLMLYICLGSGLMTFLSMMNGGSFLYDLLRFDKSLILKGQVWRLVSWLLTEQLGGGAKGAYQIGVWKALRELNICEEVTLVQEESCIRNFCFR